MGQGLFQLGLHALVALLIAIESSASDAELRRVMIESCAEARGEGSCVAASEATERAAWYARVSWDADGRRARIEIRRGSADVEPEHVRVVSFAATDAPAQRHRAVGLIVAAYVAEHGLPEAAAPAEAVAAPVEKKVASDAGGPAKPGAISGVSPPAQPASQAPQDERSADDAETTTKPKAEPNPADDDTDDEEEDEEEDEDDDHVGDLEGATFVGAAPRSFGVDVAFLVGRALDRGAPRLGVALRGFVRPETWPLGVTVALRGARRSAPSSDAAGTSLLFVSAGVGALLRLEGAGSPLALELRAELLAERLHASAQSPVTQLHEGDGRWRVGGSLGVEGHLELGGGFALFLGGDASLLSPAVSLDVGGTGLGRAPPLGASGLLGVRWAR